MIVVACNGSSEANANLDCIAAAHAASVQQSQPTLQELPTEANQIVERWTRDPVVKSIRAIAKNQPSNTPATLYSFAQPRWDNKDRSSLGFRAVARELADGTFEEKLLYQTPGIAGKVSRRTIYSNKTRAAPVRCEFARYERLDGSQVFGSLPQVDVGRQTASVAFNEYGSSCDDLVGRGAVHTTGISYNDAYGFNFVATAVSDAPSTGSLTVANFPYEPNNLYWWGDRWIVGLVGQTDIFATSDVNLVVCQNPVDENRLLSQHIGA